MTVRIESPFPLYAVPRVWTWLERVRKHVADDFGPQTLEAFLAQWETSKAMTWGVWRDGELGGMVSFEAASPVLGVMHFVFKQSFWGKETTDAALREICAQIFATGIAKIAAFVFRDNRNVIGLVHRMGGKTEGVLRSHTQRNGRLVDMVAIGFLKEEFEKCPSSQSWAA